MRRLAISISTALAGCISLAACKATHPGSVETSLVQWTKHNLTMKGSHDRNPLQDNAKTNMDGKKAFGYYCVVCHGLDGQNTGVPFAANMSPPIPSLASKEIQLYSDGQLKWIIENGISPSGMPSSHGILSDEEMWSIVVYMRHLPSAGSVGEPRLYGGGEAGSDFNGK